MIVPVKKAKIFILENYKTDLLVALQKSEIIMLTNNTETKDVDVKYEDDIIQRATTIVNRLAAYHDKASFLYYHTVDYEEFVKEDIKRIDLLESLETDFNLLEKLKQSNENLSKVIKDLAPFKKLPYTTSDLSKSLYVTFHLGYISEIQLEVYKEHFLNEKIEFELFELSDYGYPVIIVLDKESEKEALDKIKSLGFIQAELPVLSIKIGVHLKNLEQELVSNEQTILTLENKFKDSFKLSEELKVLIDQTNAKKSRMLVNFSQTESTFYVEGWVREDQISQLKTVISEVTENFDIDISEPGANEAAPTATKNNKFVHQFETLTNMYSVPNSKEIDPNPVMSVWYWILFGIMMGDMGYGLLMVVLLGLFIKLKKPKGSFSQLVHILYYAGYTSMLAGFVYGSIFGFDVDVIKWIGNLFGQNWKSFSLMDNIMPMLIISIAIGVLHIISGLILKVMLSMKHNDSLTALADGVSWILILVGGSLSAISLALIKSNILLYLGVGLIAIGLILILVLSGRDKKGIVRKVTSGLGGIYGIVNYLSDLLSYSRILALALSSAVIASTMNLLADLVQGNWFGNIMSVVIYIIGHVFNLAMGLLSAYVHDSRLQYIEFFGKFYEGGGYEFKPLSFETKYINEITN